MTNASAESPWRLLEFLIGAWTGTGSGMPGKSAIQRTYEFILDRQFMRLTDRAVYEPQERNPEGEVHQELGLFSYDRERGCLVLREFHIEGYVNQYVLVSVTDDGKTLVFKTEAMENMPSGWQARTTYMKHTDDHFTERFELRQPEGEWSCLIESELRRVHTT